MEIVRRTDAYRLVRLEPLPGEEEQARPRYAVLSVSGAQISPSMPRHEAEAWYEALLAEVRATELDDDLARNISRGR
jgi:hypothetical protein